MHNIHLYIIRTRNRTSSLEIGVNPKAIPDILLKNKKIEHIVTMFKL